MVCRLIQQALLQYSMFVCFQGFDSVSQILHLASQQELVFLLLLLALRPNCSSKVIRFYLFSNHSSRYDKVVQKYDVLIEVLKSVSRQLDVRSQKLYLANLDISLLLVHEYTPKQSCLVF